MKVSAFLSFFAALFMLTSVQSREAPPAVVTHVAAVKKTETALRFSEEIRIVLPAPENAPPGCEWQITSNDSRILRVVLSPKPSTPADLAAAAEKSGAPHPSGAWTTTFLALRPGRSMVRIAYVRPVERGEATSIVTREINVVVN